MKSAHKREKQRQRKEGKKKRRGLVRNMAIIAIAAASLAVIISYNYAAEQTRQEGLRFGVELEAIQDEVKEIQTQFYSEKTKWEEGDISREQLLGFYDGHIERFGDVISRYDALAPPDIFEGSVALLKLSSQSQMDSDSEYIEWIKSNDGASRARSDALLQDALEYELLGLVEFYSAKTGVKAYDDSGEKFEEPQRNIPQKVSQVVGHMIEECNEEFGMQGRPDAPPDDSSGMNISNVIASGGGSSNAQWAACIAEAEEWRSLHTP